MDKKGRRRVRVRRLVRAPREGRREACHPRLVPGYVGRIKTGEETEGKMKEKDERVGRTKSEKRRGQSERGRTECGRNRKRGKGVIDRKR